MTELIRFPFARSGGKFAVETGVNIFTASEKNKTLECPINSEMVYLTVTPQFRLSGNLALYEYYPVEGDIIYFIFIPFFNIKKTVA